MNRIVATTQGLDSWDWEDGQLVEVVGFTEMLGSIGAVVTRRDGTFQAVPIWGLRRIPDIAAAYIPDVPDLFRVKVPT